jgi:hypothetical protein
MLFERRMNMKTLKITTIMFLFAFGLFNTIAAAKPASVMLREGLYAEEVEGNIDAAIKIYEQIVKDKSASRDNVAQALYRQGMCYLKKKDDAGAGAAFGKLMAEYSDQTEIVDKVKPLLDDLMNYDPADLMPPGTLIYVELGSPGEQIETILNMLKGTPFENPLAAIGGGNAPAAGTGQKSPADVFAALLNPSMMAEFKKIRGMAVGITDIRQSNPPMVAVLFPGKSDALRGLILAALSVAGTPGEPLEGMQTLNIQNVGAAAYDDTVILIAQPAEQLKWCVRQYKGLTSEPTLASSNISFAKLSKNQRQNNALTAWVNVDEAYTRVLQMFPAGQIPKEVLWANAIADFNHIDYMTFASSIEQDGHIDTTEIVFKDGHHCLVYDLIRTPNISKAALEAVPPDVIAIASFALSAEELQSSTIRAQVKNITGLDIGREIFANVEQVTVFAMPPKTSNPFLPEYIGLAITSHNPQQTRQILANTLGTADAVLSGRPAPDINSLAGRYQIGIVKNNPMFCYVEQAGKTTVLSLSPDVARASVAAIKDHNSVCTTGLLSSAVAQMPAGASKMILINAGGAIRLAGPMIIESLGGENRDVIQDNLNQLALACDKTTIEIRTDEQLNNFTLNRKLTGMPPLNQVFGPITQIAQTIEKTKTGAKSKKLRGTMAATIMPAATPPVIDGNEDDVWSAAPQYKIANVVYSPLSSPNDLSADFRAMWDENNLYVLVDVMDDILRHDSTPDKWYEDDSVEVYIDASNSKSSQYGQTDYQYTFNWDKTLPKMQETKHNRTEGVQYVLVTTDKGYRVEIKFPWSTLGAKPFAGAKIGLDIHVNDNDSGKRDHKIAWFAEQDNAWENPQAFGNAELAGLVGWWKFDETEGATAKDSSDGNHNGTLIGNAKWAQGKIGGAVDLDGKSGFVQIADESAFNITGQITIACWANIRSVPYEYTAIVTKGDDSWRLSTAQQQRKFHCSVNNYNNIVLDGSAEVAANEWHHVAMVYNGDEIRIYVDGRLDAAKPWKGGIAANDFDVLIGDNAEQKGRFFDGLIDDVRIYNYALKESDIMAMFNEGPKQ